MPMMHRRLKVNEFNFRSLLVGFLFLLVSFLAGFRIRDQGCNVTAGNFYFYLFGNFKSDGGVVYGNDGTVNSTRGDNPVSLLEVADHFLVLFGFFLLGPNQKKIKNGKQDDDGQKTC